MPYQPRRPSRPPRREELALLVSLLDGPRSIARGPLGRCLKRGWCARIGAPAGPSATCRDAGWTPPVFALTLAGLQALAGARMQAPAAVRGDAAGVYARPATLEDVDG
jgi:hypothetical protein